MLETLWAFPCFKVTYACIQMILRCIFNGSVGLSISRNLLRYGSLTKTYRQVKGSSRSIMKYCQQWLERQWLDLSCFRGVHSKTVSPRCSWSSPLRPYPRVIYELFIFYTLLDPIQLHVLFLAESTYSLPYWLVGVQEQVLENLVEILWS